MYGKKRCFGRTMKMIDRNFHQVFLWVSFRGCGLKHGHGGRTRMLERYTVQTQENRRTPMHAAGLM
jgi:hypothetical protein